MLMPLRRTAGWSLVLLLSLAVVAYSGAVLVTRAFPSPLRPSLHAHGFAISLHIAGAVLALGLGPFQFLPRLRRRHLDAHRWAGRLYLLGVLAGGSAGLYLAAWRCFGWQPPCWGTGRSGRGGSRSTAAGWHGALPWRLPPSRCASGSPAC